MRKLCVGYPNLPNNDVLHAALDDILDSHRLTNNGPYVRELELRCAKFLEVEHAIAVCNATVGLQIVAMALDLKGQVIMPSWTFVATAHAMKWVGLEPIFCDILPSHTIDPTQAERIIGDNTSAILGVHLWGNACAVGMLDVVGKANDIAVFYDAAHAFGCMHNGKRIGNFGNAEVFSLHATKCIHSFEGGVITTNDADLAEVCKQMRNFGFVGYDAVCSTGTNGKMSEIHAAMGLAMLDQYDAIVRANKANFDVYFERLSPLPGIFVLSPKNFEAHNYHYVVIEVNSAMASVTRDTVVSLLQENGILARRYFYPGIHRMPPYATAYRQLPITERMAESTLALPTGLGVTPDDANYVCDIIEKALCKSLF